MASRNQTKMFGVCLLLAAAGIGAGQTVTLAPLSAGAAAKVGGYRPQQLMLSAERPATISKLPPGLLAPLYGVLPLGPRPDPGAKPMQNFHVIVDEPEGKDPALYVDANGNGDFTDDPRPDWKPREYRADGNKPYTQHDGGTTLQIRYPDTTLPAHLGLYRFDKHDPGRAATANLLVYYSDYGYEGQVDIGGIRYKAILSDEEATGDFRGQPAGKESGIRLLLDLNRNGRYEPPAEAFDIRDPFNIEGTTYEVSGMPASGATFAIVKSARMVAAAAMPVDHSVGAAITPFLARTMDGAQISFPETYKGKIVMIDFWATWCAPCMEELPTIAGVYADLHAGGFEVVGVTLDYGSMGERIAAVAKEKKMTWPQVYDGLAWKGVIPQLYAIKSLPTAYLVDADTAEILADSRTLRGGALRGTVEKALAKKKAESKN